jgi:5-methylcytosine-specific restriction endonuclease McrA
MAQNADKRHAYTMAHRARKRAAFVESVNRKVVYERDGGVCGVCGLSVAKREMSLDHIRPLSKGGEHSYRNIQLTHGRCNSSKGATFALLAET